MKKKLIHFAMVYLNSFWFPVACFFLALFMNQVSAHLSLQFDSLRYLALVFVFILIIAFVGLFLATLWNFFHKSWMKFLVNFVVIFLVVGAVIYIAQTFARPLITHLEQRKLDGYTG